MSMSQVVHCVVNTMLEGEHSHLLEDAVALPLTNPDSVKSSHFTPTLWIVILMSFGFNFRSGRGSDREEMRRTFTGSSKTSHVEEFDSEGCSSDDERSEQEPTRKPDPISLPTRPHPNSTGKSYHPQRLEAPALKQMEVKEPTFEGKGANSHRAMYRSSALGFPLSHLALPTLPIAAVPPPISEEGATAPSTGRSDQRTPRRSCRNILVVGPSQAGKSSLINAYRAVVQGHSKWPVAPVGLCGRYGTCSIEHLPNSLYNPTQVLTDTPGRWFKLSDESTGVPRTGDEKEGEGEGRNKDEREGAGSKNEVDKSNDKQLLGLLFDGLPKTKLVGPKAVKVSDLCSDPSFKPHQCIVVLSALDLVQTEGSYFWRRCVPKPEAESIRLQLRDLLDEIRSLQQDRAPFVVITHLDRLQAYRAEACVRNILHTCVPSNRCYFVELPDSQAVSSHSSVLHRRTVQEILKLHQEMMMDIGWAVESGLLQLTTRQGSTRMTPR
jgi:hypothetical protein